MKSESRPAPVRRRPGGSRPTPSRSPSESFRVRPGPVVISHQPSHWVGVECALSALQVTLAAALLVFTLSHVLLLLRLYHDH